MYEPGKIMKCGGSDSEGSPGIATTWVVDLNGANPANPPAWLNAGSMNLGRLHHNLVILPDGKILAVGGTRVDSNNEAFAVRKPEIFDPVSGTWTLQENESADPRMYHSTAMLLRDGRVVSAGGDNFATAQIFKPPYIHETIPRTSIVSAPAYMQYGQQYTIGYHLNDAPEVTKVCLIRLAAVTHGFDQDQRYVPLIIPEEIAPNPPVYNVKVLAPPNGNTSPPGYYMLFILSEYALNQFAPCELAAYVQVGP